MTADNPDAQAAEPPRRLSGRRRLLAFCAALLGAIVAIAAGCWWYVRYMDIGPEVEVAGGRYSWHKPYSPVAAFLRKLTGGATVDYTIRFSPGRVTDAWLQRNRFRLEAMSMLNLTLCNPQITDEGIRQLSAAFGITWLDVSESGTTDAGVAALQGLSGLTALELRNTRVTDDAIPMLASIPALNSLSIAGTEVSDAGIARLPGGKFSGFGLDRTQLTPVSLQSPLLQGAFHWFSLYDADDATVALLPDIAFRGSLVLQGEKVTSLSLPVLEELIRTGTLRYLQLLDTQLTDDEVQLLKQIDLSCRVIVMTTFKDDRIRDRSRPITNGESY